MRSDRFMGLHAGIAFLAMSGASEDRNIVIIGDDPPVEPERPPQVQQRVAPAPRQLTEADNTRLRQAAERRFRKVQLQARGFAQ